MNVFTLIILLILIVLIGVGVFLVIAWAMSEADKHREPPLFERLRAGAWSVELRYVGRRRPAVLRVVREATGVGLRDAMALVVDVPRIVAHDIAREDAEEMVARFEAAGAEAAILPAAEVPADEVRHLV